MITKRDFFALILQIFIFFMGIMLIWHFNILGFHNSNDNAQYQGYTMEQFVKADPNSNCDKTVKNHTPNYYHGDWKVECTDELHNAGKVQGKIYGVTLPEHHIILINRNTPANLMIYTLDHEYAHSVDFDNNLQFSGNWKKWVKYLTDNYGVIENLTYYDRPNEILADNVSRCYNNNQDEIMGFVTVNCKEIYKLFPEYKTKIYEGGE